jgi:hypothetical protein
MIVIALAHALTLKKIAKNEIRISRNINLPDDSANSNFQFFYFVFISTAM